MSANFKTGIFSGPNALGLGSLGASDVQAPAICATDLEYTTCVAQTETYASNMCIGKTGEELDICKQTWRDVWQSAHCLAGCTEKIANGTLKPQATTPGTQVTTTPDGKTVTTVNGNVVSVQEGSFLEQKVLGMPLYLLLAAAGLLVGGGIIWARNRQEY